MDDQQLRRLDAACAKLTQLASDKMFWLVEDALRDDNFDWRCLERHLLDNRHHVPARVWYDILITYIPLTSSGKVDWRHPIIPRMQRIGQLLTYFEISPMTDGEYEPCKTISDFLFGSHW